MAFVFPIRPLYFLSVADTPTSPRAQQAFMAQEIPTCHLAVYPDVGHGINVLRPQWCVQQVREFVAPYAAQ